jgi:hypothetical protein
MKKKHHNTQAESTVLQISIKKRTRVNLMLNDNLLLFLNPKSEIDKNQDPG